jgi:hypothetical protein
MPMAKNTLNVDGLKMDSRFPHEAGHALVAALTSNDPVRICDGAHKTDTGHSANAICTVDFKRGDDETQRDLTLRRIAYHYGGVFGEAYFVCETEHLESCVLRSCAECLWRKGDGTKGDAAKVTEIHKENPCLTGDERKALNSEAWNKAAALVKANGSLLKEIAKRFCADGHLSNEQIRCMIAAEQNRCNQGVDDPGD